MTNQANEQARRLARVIVAQHDQTTCDACLDQLEEYISAQLAGEDYTVLFPAVAPHLDSCAACAKSYALLYEVRLAENDVRVPASIPEPDFSFLQGSTAYASVPEPDFNALHSSTTHASVPEPDFSVLQGSTAHASIPEPDFNLLQATAKLRKALTSAVERAGAQLRVTLTQALLDALPPPLQLAPALAVRGSADGEAGPGIALVDLELDEPEEEITRLHLTAHLKANPSSRCMIRVELALQGRDWPDLAEIPVILRLDDGQRQALTDAWGVVIFDDVPTIALPGLQVAVDASAAPPTTT
jgi:hypothetical protein